MGELHFGTKKEIIQVLTGKESVAIICMQPELRLRGKRFREGGGRGKLGNRSRENKPWKEEEIATSREIALLESLSRFSHDDRERYLVGHVSFFFPEEGHRKWGGRLLLSGFFPNQFLETGERFCAGVGSEGPSSISHKVSG